MYSLDQKIEEYTEEAFADLGLASLSEEKKADIFARIQEQFQKAILTTLRGAIRPEDLAAIEGALEQENFEALTAALKRHPQFREELEKKIQKEFDQIKLTIAEEQKNGQDEPGGLSGTGQPAGL